MRDVAELPTRGDADIAAVASLLADPARCKVLLALDDGRALPASVLADEAGISRPTASSHLRKLTDAGLLVGRNARQAPLLPAGRSRGRRRYSSTSSGWRRRARFARCGKAPAPPGCAPRVRVTTISRVGSACRSWAACWTARCSSAVTAVSTRIRDGRDALSSPGHDVHYELTDDGPRLPRRGRRRIAIEQKASRAVLRRLDRAAPPLVRCAGPCGARPFRLGGLGEAGTPRTGGDGDRRRPGSFGRERSVSTGPPNGQRHQPGCGRICGVVAPRNQESSKTAGAALAHEQNFATPAR